MFKSEWKPKLYFDKLKKKYYKQSKCYQVTF